jgi:predicted AAA+ superfamily ATPase
MRYLHPFIKDDLKKKMVFIGGPRQSGKTTLAQEVASDYKTSEYFNWDYLKDKKNLLEEKWDQSTDLLLFDEIHKYSDWKNWLKGLYDVKKNLHKFLITGSARLDLYKKGGDSMLGRYHYWRLHPFTMCELPKGIKKNEAFKKLMDVGGFPEPFLDSSNRFASRWRTERLTKIIREDVRDLSLVKDIDRMQILLEKLQDRAGQLISVANLAKDLQVSPNTITRWIEVLEQMYVIFRVFPYVGSNSRSIQSHYKIYFYDNGDTNEDRGTRFENLVATHLLKQAHFLSDSTGIIHDIAFIRDREKREVDFVLLKKKTPYALIEAKWSDDKISSHLKYYADKIPNVEVVQILGEVDRTFTKDNIQIVRAMDYLSKFKYFA